MKTSIKLLLLTTILSSCVPATEIDPATGNPPTHLNAAFLTASTPPGADIAVGIVLDAYGYWTDQPSIYWYDGSRLDCPGHPDSWLIPGTQLCADGQFWPETNEVAISTWGGGYPIHRLSLAHELCHWWAFKTTGDGDPGHTGLCVPEGSGGAIDRANTILAGAGY